MGDLNIGDWVRSKSNHDLAQMIGRELRVYYDPIPDCPFGCLEGDGGQGGAPDDKFYKVKPPSWRWCDHCKENNYNEYG